MIIERKQIVWWGMSFIALAFLAGCSLISPPATPTATLPPPTATPLPPTATPLPPTPTPVPPTDTPPPPTATPTELLMLLPTDTLPPPPPPTITPTPVIENAIVVYLVRKGEATPVKKSQKDKEDKDNKKKVVSECDDTLVYISSGLPRTGVIENDVASALARLFATPLYAAGLYNPTHNSTFVVTKVTYKANAGQVTVDLDGSYVRSGDRCDNRRVRDQIWTTVRQFTGVKTVTVYVNGNLLGDVLANDR